MFNRNITCSQKIIITDGIPSSGKSLACNLISSLPKVDPFVLNHNIEHIIGLNKLGILKNDISEYLIKTNHNVFFHDHLLLRNANFRKSDFTSIQKNPKYHILKQRLDSDENKVIKKNKDKVIAHYCLHFATHTKKILFQTFKNKLLFIQVLRSPSTLTMIKRIADWTLQIEKSKSRDGHLKFFDKKSKKNFPYFIKDKSKEYLSANKYEKAIMIIDKYINIKIINETKYSKNFKSNEVVIPFENLCEEPKKYLTKISKMINSKIDHFALTSIKKNYLPRHINIEKEKVTTLKYLKNKIRLKYYQKILKLQNLYENKILNQF